MKEKLLEFKNLVTEFRTEGKTVKAVNDISFTLNKGETIGIVGESGSGKSVTSLSAMRLIPSPPGIISGGEIIFHQKSSEPIDPPAPVTITTLLEMLRLISLLFGSTLLRPIKSFMLTSLKSAILTLP